MYRVISIEVSFHTCFKISFSSNIVDSQSFASEKGVILILSSLISKSGLELVLPGVMVLDELLASGGAPGRASCLGRGLSRHGVSKKNNPPNKFKRRRYSLLNQTFVLTVFFIKAKTESVTFVTTGDNKFVMS